MKSNLILLKHQMLNVIVIIRIRQGFSQIRLILCSRRFTHKINIVRSLNLIIISQIYVSNFILFIFYYSELLAIKILIINSKYVLRLIKAFENVKRKETSTISRGHNKNLRARGIDKRFRMQLFKVIVGLTY